MGPFLQNHAEQADPIIDSEPGLVRRTLESLLLLALVWHREGPSGQEVDDGGQGKHHNLRRQRMHDLARRQIRLGSLGPWVLVAGFKLKQNRRPPV